MGEVREAFKIVKFVSSESGSGFGSYVSNYEEFYTLTETNADNLMKEFKKRIHDSDLVLQKTKIKVIFKDNKIADISNIEYHELYETKQDKLKILNDKKRKALDKLTEDEKELLNIK